MKHDDLLKLVLQLQKQLAKQAKRIEELAGELKELRKKNPAQRLDDAYSVKAEEKRREDALQDAKPKKKKPKSIRRGRISTAEKLAMATQEERICPAGYSLEECTFRYSRVAWRIINGQAVLVAYHIYASPDGCGPQVPGVPGRGEFGREIITSLACQYTIAGLPLDTVIGEFEFYWNLTLRKSQADSILYQGFSKAQKCWAHLLRKAIRLTLLKLERKHYETFVDSLLGIYRKGKAIAADKRLSEAGRRAGVDQLVNAVCHCTGARFADETKPADEAEKDFFNLTHEIVRLMSDDELFTFVIYPEADGTNNISERQLRAPAQDRVTGRTNKTERGGRRRTVITSVLDSLRAHVPRLILKTVLNELDRWQKTGISCFRRLVKKLKLPALSLPEKIVSPLELLVSLNKSPAK